MAVSDDRVIEYINSEIERSHWVRQHYEPEWEDQINLYMNYLTTDMPPGSEWIDNRFIPDGFRIVETITPQIVMGMYQSPRWLTIEAPGFPGVNYSEMCRAYLLGVVDRAGFVPRSIPKVRMLQILGHLVQKTYWHTEESERIVRIQEPGLDESGQIVPVSRLDVRRETTFNGPWVEWPDLKTVWKSLERDRFGRHIWYVHARDTTVSILENENASYGNKLYAEGVLRKLRSSLSFRPTDHTSGISTHFSNAGFGEGGPLGNNTLEDDISQISRHQRLGRDSVNVREWCGFVPESVRKYDDTQWRKIEIANGETRLSDYRIPSHDGRPFYDEVFGIQVGDEPYGHSVLKWTMGEIEQTSIMRNARQAEVFMNLFGTYIADADVDMDNPEMARMPGGIWWYRNNGEGSQGIIAPLPKQPVLPEAYTETAIMEDHYLKTAAATEAYQGAFAPGGSHRTLGEFQGTVALGSARHRQMIMLNDLQMKKPFIERAFKLSQIFLEDPVLVELATNHEIRDAITYRDLRWDIDVLIDTGEFGMVDQQRLNALVQLFSMFAGSQEGQFAHKTRQIMEDAYYYAGFPRAHRYVKSEEEIRAEMEAAQTQALLEQALSGGGNRGPQG